MGKLLKSTSGSDSEIALYFRQTVQTLDDIRKEPGAEKVTDRFDLKPIYSEASSPTQAAGN
jgi:hypothetical protein